MTLNTRIEGASPSARLAVTRAELQRLLEPASGGSSAHGNGASSEFPRSATMRFLTGGRGKGALLLSILGFLATRRATNGRWGRYLGLGSLISKALFARLTANRTDSS